MWKKFGDEAKHTPLGSTQTSFVFNILYLLFDDLFFSGLPRRPLISLDVHDKLILNLLDVSVVIFLSKDGFS